MCWFCSPAIKRLRSSTNRSSTSRSSTNRSPTNRSSTGRSVMWHSTGQWQQSAKWDRVGLVEGREGFKTTKTKQNIPAHLLSVLYLIPLSLLFLFLFSILSSLFAVGHFSGRCFSPDSKHHSVSAGWRVDQWPEPGADPCVPAGQCQSLPSCLLFLPGGGGGVCRCDDPMSYGANLAYTWPSITALNPTSSPSPTCTFGLLYVAAGLRFAHVYEGVKC